MGVGFNANVTNTYTEGYANRHAERSAEKSVTSGKAQGYGKGATAELSSEGMQLYRDSMNHPQEMKAESQTEDSGRAGIAGEYLSKNNSDGTTKSVVKMSEADRAALVQQLKADQEKQQSRLAELVSKMMGGQAKAYGIATGDDSIWKMLAKGDFTVDAATKSQAQKNISEDGYWGVKQTSQRLFDFASALAGDDVEKMKKMQAAMEKGFKQAEKAWSGALPGISHQTMSAANRLFEDYYASKGVDRQQG